jgi:hypothetical protein
MIESSRWLGGGLRKLRVGRKRGGRKRQMKTFLICDLRFLIGGWPVTRIGGLFARMKRAPSQRTSGARAPMFPCKHMIFRRLGPFCMFFAPFLSQKGLIFRRLQRKRGLIKFAVYGKKEMSSRRSLHPLFPAGRDCFAQRAPGERRQEEPAPHMKKQMANPTDNDACRRITTLNNFSGSSLTYQPSGRASFAGSRPALHRGSAHV